MSKVFTLKDKLKNIPHAINSFIIAYKNNSLSSTFLFLLKIF